MSKKKPAKKKSEIKISSFYDSNGKRIHKVCPKCGAGVFMAEHKDRWSCGKCGYTEFKRN